MPPQTPPENNYDFFLNPPPAPKTNPLLKLKSSKGMAIKLLVGGVVLLLLVVLISVIFGGSSTGNLLSLAQQQNELIRVSTEGLSDATQQSTKNLAINIELSLTSDQQQLLTFMRNHSQGVSTSQLSSTKNTATDQQLQNAINASDVDSVYLQITQAALNTYQQDIKQVFDSSTNASERQLLNDQYKYASLLVEQANSATKALQNS